MEKFIRSLRNSRNPILQRIFGFPPRLLESDPEVQLRIISEVERKIYGSEGIDSYETREHSELKRAARRSTAQFLCQKAQFTDSWVKAAWLLGLWVSLLPLAGYLLLKTLQDSKIEESEGVGRDLVIRLSNDRLRPIWNQMFKDRDFYIHARRSVLLGRPEISFALRAIRVYPPMLFHPKLLANLLRWLGTYGYVLRRLKPNAIAHCSEGIASSSLITAYLHEHDVRHINLTHGERMILASSAFYEFDEDFLWGEHFKEISLKVKPRVGRYVIAGNFEHRLLFQKIRPGLQPRPKRILIIHNPLLTKKGKDFSILLNILGGLDSSWEIRIRRHPLWGSSFVEYLTALKEAPKLRELALNIEEESHPEASLVDALAKSRIVVGGSSAALIEAWIAGCKVVCLEGVASRSSVMDRHQGSENMFYATDKPADLERAKAFVQTPAVLSGEEDSRVNFLSQVLPA